MKKSLLVLVILIATCKLWAGNVITYTADCQLEETTDQETSGLHTSAFKEPIIDHTFSDGIGTITFSGDVTSIGDYAFYNCSKLTSIDIPNSVKSIGEGAFSACFMLKTFNMPNSVTSIGISAFSSCLDLTEISISSSVTVIKEGTFYGCRSLSVVTIPQSVSTIRKYAFEECTGIVLLSVPNTVKTIEQGAFYKVKNIQYSGTALGTTWGALCKNGFVDGYMVYLDESKRVLNGCSSLAEGEIILPSSVTTIGSSAFYQCWDISSISLPNSVTSIGSSAFSGCSGLTSITIPESVTSIGEWAFGGCSGLTSITIPKSVTSIGYGAFYGCSGLTSITIPNSVTNIGEWAFSGCSGLTSIIIPGSVTSIGGGAFYDCYRLFAFSIPSSVTSIGQQAFHNIKHIYYNGPATGSPWGALCHNGFIEGNLVYRDDTKKELLGCNTTAEGDVIIPNSVKKIGNNVFSDCREITNVVIPNTIDSIGDESFYYCSKLTEINIPNSVVCIGKYAFAYCSNLQKMILPQTLEKVDDGIARGCSNLKSVIIPDSVSSIGDFSFAWCSNLSSIIIPHSVTSIGGQAFNGCANLPSIIIPSSLKEIKDKAFYDCTNLKVVYNLSSLNIVKGYASNGYAGYYADDVYKTLVATINVNSNDTTMGTAFAIYNETDSSTFSILPGTEVVLKASANYGYKFRYWNNSIENPQIVKVKSDTTFWAYFEKETFSIFVQSANNMMGAVYGRGEKTYLDEYIISAIPEPGYEFVTWDDGNKENPRTIRVEKDCSFTAYFTQVEKGICGNNVTWQYINDTLFIFGTGNMYNYNAPTSIPWIALREDIKTVIIEDGVSSIGNYAFSMCKNIESVSIPKSITRFGDYAFYECSKITTIHIPESTTHIGVNSFRGCVGIFDIYSYTEIPIKINDDSFYDLDQFSTCLHVYFNSIEKYKIALGWRYFYNVVAIGAESTTFESSTITVLPNDNTVTIGWPSNEKAEKYIIEIRQDGKVFCQLVFNKNGQFMEMSFSPYIRKQRMSAADSVINGWTFTINGLNPGTEYDYSITTKDKQEHVVSYYNGTFTTTGEVTGIDETTVNKYVNTVTKILRDGQLLILRDGKVYNAQGVLVEE